MKDGANIPPCASPAHKWNRVDEIPLNAAALAQLSVDPAITMENLVTRGYHVAQPVGDIFRFQQSPFLNRHLPKVRRATNGCARCPTWAQCPRRVRKFPWLVDRILPTRQTFATNHI